MLRLNWWRLPIALIWLSLLGAPTLVDAQDYDRPSGFNDDGADSRDGGYSANRGAADAPDSGMLGIRMGKLENRLREMTGQIEELQNANRKLVEQLQKFQADVESRLSTGGGRQKRSDLETPRPKTDEASAADTADTGASTEAGRRKGRRNDAFDPDAAAAAGAPGMPKPLGSPGSAQADAGATGGPMDLAGSRLGREGDSSAMAPTLRLPSTSRAPGEAAASGPAVASAGNAAAPSTPRGEYDAALSLYRDKQYENAEKGFAAFIQKNPKSKLAAEATYYLGETFAQRGRSREAAEQYLKISTDYANSTRAPDAMLHLGLSLKALGAKEQACATFSEVTRKYPNAPAYVRNGAEREAKRAQC